MVIDDLLEYLKECIDDEHWFEIAPNLAKALYDHISELEAENKRLKELLELGHQNNSQQFERLMRMADEISELRQPGKALWQ